MPYINQQIGPYTLIKKLGQGGFGAVWLAEKKTKFVTKNFAVKLPLKDQVDADAVRHEATLWEQASGHSNVLPIIDADEFDGQIAIVSEYAPDGSLADLLKKQGRLSVEKAIEMIDGILAGLEYLHSKNIIHRDLKPENVLLQGETPRLADFGISRILRATVPSMTVKIVGSPFYMAPECFQYKRNQQTDIWSIGVIFYELLGGKKPFVAQSMDELVNKICYKDIEPLPENIPQDLAETVKKSLSKKVENRFQTAGEMREALRNFQINIINEDKTKKKFWDVKEEIRFVEIEESKYERLPFVTKEEKILYTENNETIDDTETAYLDPIENDILAPNDKEFISNEMDFRAILEQFDQEQTQFSSGELVQGKVVGISERRVLIDFGYMFEGIVEIEEFRSLDGKITVKVGDEVEVVIRSMIRSMDSGDKLPILSYSDAILLRAWAEIEEAFKNEMPIIGHVVEKIKGGLKVEIGGVEAFLPGSQIDSQSIRNLDPFVGQDIEVKVIKFSRKRNNIVLSRKVLTDETENHQKFETLSNLEEGNVVEGRIKSLTEYGAFVDLGGIDGLLHVTDMSWGRLQNPNHLFKVGDSVQAKVLKLDRTKEKVSLGYKQLLPDPWSTVGETYPIDSKTKGKVLSVTDYGAFIELEPGVEGLVHVSEMSWSKRAKHPKSLVEIGEEVEVQVLGIDTQDRRISLGMKQLMPSPWESIRERYQVGSKVQGKVRNITDFGAFIEVEDGVDGLVHVSDISWSKKIKHPNDALKKGQDVEAVITRIDVEGRLISLSIKELAPSAWDSFVVTHKPGDLVKGKVSRFASFGVFVDLGEDLEGLCHISELANERVERPEQVVSLGQEMDFKIIRIEADVQKIGLSARSVRK